jgi:hypothetical protein
MKKLLLILLLPLSIITFSTAQKKTNEELLPAVSIQDYFNYVKLDEVFEVFKKKYNFKIRTMADTMSFCIILTLNIRRFIQRMATVQSI